MLKNEQAKDYVEKVNERVIWYTISEINYMWEEVTGAISHS